MSLVDSIASLLRVLLLFELIRLNIENRRYYERLEKTESGLIIADAAKKEIRLKNKSQLPVLLPIKGVNRVYPPYQKIRLSIRY